MRNKGSFLDFIEFFRKSSVSNIEIIAPLYKKGLSISDISDQTGLKRNSIWRSLKSYQKELRPQGAVPFVRWRKGRGKPSSRPPYGYCYFQGEIIKDPKEYPTLQLIQSLWKQGIDISSIMLKLAGRGSLSRMNKSWSYNVIKAIIQRTKNGDYGSIESNKNSF